MSGRRGARWFGSWVLVLALVLGGCSSGDEAPADTSAGAPSGGSGESREDAADPGAHRFTAGGNEPGWRLEVTGARLVLVADYGEVRIEHDDVARHENAGGRRITAGTGTDAVAVTVTDAVCHDDATGMPHPHGVSVEFRGRTLRGCGGRPEDLLEGGEWVVEDIDGAGIVDRSRVTLEFADGTLVGMASCNRYTTTYVLTGEGLTASPAAATGKACPEALMNQEDRFLDVLASVRRFSVDGTGALILHGSEGRTLLARR